MMNRQYHKWFSPNLYREMELLVYGHCGARVLLFPTRCGRFFDYENLRIIESIRHFIENGWLQVFTIDSVDQESFYCNYAHPEDKINRHNQYERYILNEVLPLSTSLNQNPFLMSVGCSMGAYHAANFAFRNPYLVNKVVALSGRYDLTKQMWHYDDLLNGHFDDNVYLHMPYHYIKNMPEGELLNQIRKQDIRIICGQEDAFLENNIEFSARLWEKGIWHTFHQWDGIAHSARFWRQMLPSHL